MVSSGSYDLSEFSGGGPLMEVAFSSMKNHRTNLQYLCRKSYCSQTINRIVHVAVISDSPNLCVQHYPTLPVMPVHFWLGTRLRESRGVEMLMFQLSL